MDTPDDARRGAIVGIGAYVWWGFLTVYWKHLEHFGAFDLIGWRIISSAVVVSIALTYRRGWGVLRTLRDPRLLARVAIAALLLTVNWTSYVWAVVHDRIIETALGYFIAPLGTMLIGVVVFGERLRTAQRIAVVFGIASIVVLTISYGDVPWLAITIAVSWNLYALMKKRVPLSPLEGMSAETFVLLVPAIVVIAALHGRADSVVSGATPREAVLVALAGVATIVPLTMFAHAAPRVPLTVLGPMMYSVPTINFLLGWLAYDEALPAARLVGFGLVWVGLLVLTVDGVSRTTNVRSTRPGHEPVLARTVSRSSRRGEES